MRNEHQASRPHCTAPSPSSHPRLALFLPVSPRRPPAPTAASPHPPPSRHPLPAQVSVVVSVPLCCYARPHLAPRRHDGHRARQLSAHGAEVGEDLLQPAQHRAAQPGGRGGGRRREGQRQPGERGLRRRSQTRSSSGKGGGRDSGWQGLRPGDGRCGTVPGGNARGPRWGLGILLP